MRRLIPLLLAVLMLGAVFAIHSFQPPTPQQQTQTKEQTVYTTKTGKKYHRATCRYLSKSKIPISLKDAKAQGLTACTSANPLSETSGSVGVAHSQAAARTASTYRAVASARSTQAPHHSRCSSSAASSASSFTMPRW